MKKAEKMTKLGIAVDDHTLNRIESYRFGHWIQTRNEALLHIIEIGLDQIEQASTGDHDLLGEKTHEDLVDHEADEPSVQVDQNETECTPSDDHEPMESVPVRVIS